jgi:hypothetical protein
MKAILSLCLIVSVYTAELVYILVWNTGPIFFPVPVCAITASGGAWWHLGLYESF